MRTHRGSLKKQKHIMRDLLLEDQERADLAQDADPL